MTPSGERWRDSFRTRTFLWAVLLVYVAVASVTVIRHEMWRDEMHAWQAVVASDSLVELAGNVRSEGHPGLWVLLLYPASRVTTDPAALQLVHLAVAVAMAAVVLLLAPLPVGWRVLFVFGYFPVYEYAAISRNYAIGGLLLFIFCAVYGDRGKHPLVAAGVLALLAQASAVALVLSFSIGVMWVADAWASRRVARFRPGPDGAALALWMVGLVVSVGQLWGGRVAMQPFQVARIFEPDRVLGVLGGPWQGYVPVPRLRFAFWNSNILDGLAHGDALQAMLAIGLLFVLGGLFVRCRPALLLYVVGSGSLLAFSLLVYSGSVRHHGHHLLLLVATLWLTRVLVRSGAGGDGAPPRCGEALPRRAAVVGALLVANVAAGGYAVAREWRDPFSDGRGVADEIRARGLAGLPIVGQRDAEAAVVAGYLGQPVYCPALGRSVPFIPWSVASRRPVSDSEVLRQAVAVAEEQRREVLILLRAQARPQRDRIAGAVWVRTFPRSIVPSERFELFRLPRPDSGTARR